MITTHEHHDNVCGSAKRFENASEDVSPDPFIDPKKMMMMIKDTTVVVHIRTYMHTFCNIVPVHGVAYAELLVWTTTSRALLMGKFDKGSRQQQDLIQRAICDSE